jgi:hypothetical protein
MRSLLGKRQGFEGLPDFRVFDHAATSDENVTPLRIDAETIDVILMIVSDDELEEDCARETSRR